jgi:hypothetical protein
MVHYRALYADLLRQAPAQAEPIRSELPAERTVAAGRGRR